MTQAQIIESVLQAPPERLEAILQAARGQTNKPRPVTAKDAAATLGCHVRTLQRYARQGLLHPVVLSKRMHRFDMNEVEALLSRGAKSRGVMA